MNTGAEEWLMATGSASSTDARYLRAFVHHPDPVLTATEVADELNVTQQAAHSKLTNLQSRGLLRSKKTGSRSRAWWITTDGRELYRESTQ